MRRERVERRLAAILAADVAGYSRLMGADEEGTHARLKAHLADLVYPKIEEHRGRVVKNTGDGFLAEFASVVDAVRFAAEVQESMAEREPEVPDNRHIRFRIGINIGDVIAEEHDIFGDGVNVAARLEALAEPGGICVSRVVRDQVRDRLDIAFGDLGEQSVKNIARPVRVFALRRGGMADVPAPRSSTSTSTPPVATPRLSIVVLPFANLSNDPDQEYFADAITEDLTTDLSRLADMVVISRNTAFTYQGKRVNTKQVGRELGVRYVLEGSIRRSGNQVRVTAQLIDAESDAHIWADRFDGDAADLFALQDEITSRIAVALNLELVHAEAARPTEHPDALDYILLGRAASDNSPSRDKYAASISLFERSLALDPRSVEAQSYLAIQLTGRVLDNMSDTVPTDIQRAEVLAGQALVTSPRSPLAHFAKGQVLRVQRRPEEAASEYEAVLGLNRNWVSALSAFSWCKLFTGPIEQVIPLLERAIRLSPRDPLRGNWYLRIGQAHFLQSRLDEAVLWLEKARSTNPGLATVHANLASIHALRDETERSAVELAEARRLSADDRYRNIARLTDVAYFGPPKARALFDATYFAGLRKAGMPEE
jgi:TolB-like protein/class 3 adenylate cyclase